MNEIEKLYNKLPQKGKLEHLYLHITKSCNLKCFYCYDEAYSTKKESQLTLDEIQAIAYDCKELSLTYVTITGGEPFLNKNWFEIGRIFNEIGAIVSYSTNGTRLNEDVLKKLASINASIQISLDGNDEMMEFISKGKQIYSKTMNNIEGLKRHGIYFHLNCVVGKHNIDKIDGFMEDLNEKDIMCRMTFFCEELNPKFSEYALSIQEKYCFIMKASNFNKSRNTKNIFMTLPPLMSTEFIPMSIQPECGWAYYQAGILSNGDVTVCAPASGIDFFTAGNVRDSSFKEIWLNSDLFTKLRGHDVSELKGICAICPMKKVCIGSCRVLSYLKNQDETSACPICQEFYDAVINNEIDTDEFPIGSVKIAR